MATDAATAYRELLERSQQTHLLQSTAELLGWDQETMLPAGGVEHRSRQIALLARLTHERATDPRLRELIECCEARRSGLPEGAGANLREWRRRLERLQRVPSRLVAELAETTSRAQHEWAAARRASDFARFRPWLERVLALVRERAACLAGGGSARWDALADEYEPGVSASALTGLFGPLRARLVELVDELRLAGTPPDGRLHAVRVPIAEQEAFVRAVAARIGFDFERGRIDRSTHPFCSGSHPGDVRITTRFHDDRVLDALGSTMHEAGHGMYEQGLDVAHTGTPLGEAVSLGIHESQSRLWENHVGRSRGFWRWCTAELQRATGTAFDGFDADSMFRAANLVAPSLIRVEADEATYNLHVLVRFEIEVALVHSELDVADLPAAWNAAYRDVLGIDVPDDRSGCLQDVHWSCGLFGYFPTYTLGNLYAAQWFAAAQRDLPDLDDQFARGRFDGLRDWLRRNVHVHGSRFRPAELCERATGATLSTAPYLDYLTGKLREVYRIAR